MRSINKVILIGNLTRDPEIRQTSSGQNVATFGIATNREWSTQDGKKHSLAEFHDLVAWAHLAEICQKYLKKGKLIYVEGYLKTRSWDTPEGVKRFKTEIVIQDMIMLDKRTPGQEADYIPEEENMMRNGSGESMTQMATPIKKNEVKANPPLKEKSSEAGVPTDETGQPAVIAPPASNSKEKPVSHAKTPLYVSTRKSPIKNRRSTEPAAETGPAAPTQPIAIDINDDLGL